MCPVAYTGSRESITGMATSKKQVARAHKAVQGVQHLPRRTLVILVVGVLLALMCTYWYLVGSEKSDTSTNATLLQTEELSNEVNRLIGQGKYDEAQQVIESSETDPASGESQTLSANAYVAAGNYTEALAAFKQVEQQSGLDASLAQNIAYAANMTGDTQTAREYYQKALDLVRQDTTNPVAADMIKNIETALQQVQQ